VTGDPGPPLHEPLAGGEEGGFRAVVHLQLPEDVADVVLDVGSESEIQLRADLVQR